MSGRDRLTPGTDVDLEGLDSPRRLAPGKRNLTHPKTGSFGAAPGKLTLTRHLTGDPVPLPFQSDLEAAFGVSLAHVEAYVGQSEGLSALDELPALVGRMLRGEPDPWPGGGALGELLARGMARDARARPSAAELAEALEALAG